jgi:hypothetical protein
VLLVVKVQPVKSARELGGREKLPVAAPTQHMIVMGQHVQASSCHHMVASASNASVVSSPVAPVEVLSLGRTMLVADALEKLMKALEIVECLEDILCTEEFDVRRD